jgi:hypothetical protein
VMGLTLTPTPLPVRWERGFSVRTPRVLSSPRIKEVGRRAGLRMSRRHSLMYTRMTREDPLAAGAHLPASIGEQTMSVLVVPENIALQSLAASTGSER